MSDLKAKAYTLAETTSRYLNKPTTPPLAWRQEGDQLVVILADGRKIRYPMAIDKPKPVPIPAKTETKKPLPSIPAPSHHKKTAGNKV
jgi:hypothetical protein